MPAKAPAEHPFLEPLRKIRAFGEDHAVGLIQQFDEYQRMHTVLDSFGWAHADYNRTKAGVALRMSLLSEASLGHIATILKDNSQVLADNGVHIELSRMKAEEGEGWDPRNRILLHVTHTDFPLQEKIRKVWTPDDYPRS